MKKQAKSLKVAAFVAVLTVGVAWSCLSMSSAYAKQPTGCDMNLLKQPFLKQSTCIYQAIIADVDKTYPMLDGTIGSIAGISTWNYKVKILHDGRIAHLDYTVRIGAGGKVEIVDKKENTESKGHSHKSGPFGPPTK